jgi:hypothetical protein
MCTLGTALSVKRQKKVSLAKKVLLWVLLLTRSMTMRQLQQAIGTSPITHQFDSGRNVEEEMLLRVCCGLVVVEEESGLVRLVREFILSFHPRLS